jgi:hypothetical protein
MLRVLTEAETGRGEVLGQIVFAAAWGTFAALGDVALVHAADTGAELALLGLGTALVAWSTIRARGLFMDVVETLARWSAKTERSRILLEHQKQRHATLRTRERRFMLELAIREAEATERAVRAHQVRAEQGNREANRLHANRQRLIDLLVETYAEGTKKRWAGGQPFAKSRIGAVWFSELQRIGAIEMSHRHPQWCFAEMGDTPDEALEEILHRSPNFLALEGA